MNSWDKNNLFPFPSCVFAHYSGTEPGEYTKKLIALMKKVMERSDVDEPYYVYRKDVEAGREAEVSSARLP